MTEPDVTLTDYGLAIECAAFTYLLCRGEGRQPLRVWFALFFGSAGVAALIGGTVHGFFLDPATTGARILWPATLLAIGATTLAAWAIGARIQFSGRVARRIAIAATLEFVGYALVVVFVAQAFAVAILNYVPAAVFLLVVFFVAYRRTRARPVLVGTLGLAATFLASAVQQGEVALHPVYFNHNALYHVIQAGALLMLFHGARSLIAARAAE